MRTSCALRHCVDDAVSSASGPKSRARCTAWERHEATMSAAQMFDLKGRVALVTGASSGLGVRFAEVLAVQGAAVALVARRTDRLAALKERIEKAGGRAVAIGADMLDHKAIIRAFDEAEKAFATSTLWGNMPAAGLPNGPSKLPGEDGGGFTATNSKAV